MIDSYVVFYVDVVFFFFLSFVLHFSALVVNKDIDLLVNTIIHLQSYMWHIQHNSAAEQF